jgi:hypothetical protein
VETGGDLAAFLPSADKVRGEPIESARARTQSSAQFRGRTDSQKLPYRSAIEVQLICNGRDRQTPVVEGVDLVVTTFVAHVDAPLSWQVRFFTLLVQLGQCVGGVLLV